MTLKWKAGEGKYAGKESVFWETFQKEGGDIGVISKFRGAGDGVIPIVGAKTEADGYEYSTKAVQKKNRETGDKIPNEFWYFVERRKLSGDPIIDNAGKSEEQIAADKTRQEYQDGAKKGHEENKQMHQEEMAIIRELITAVTNLNETIIALGKRMDALEGI